MSYDYRNLSPVEFERLCADLVSLKEGVSYQRFGEGRDGGVDLLYEDAASGNKTIVQCKRYKDTAALISVLGKSEVQKVRKLNPKRYCLLTSATLTPQNKQQIKDIFSPYLKTTQDIWGCDDLDGLLDDDKYGQVVYNVPPLWLPSFNLVSRFINNGVVGRSQFEMAECIKKNSSLAWTSVCDTCMKRLETSRVVILVGDPGVGKTVTAEMVICRLSLMGYEVYVSYDGIKEFEDVYRPNTKQAFLYDDFLGSNYFDAVRNREDTSICKFADRVSHEPDKCFILTSRTTVLNHGLEASTSFQMHRFAQHHRMVDVNGLTNEDKAHILYKLLSMSCCNREALIEYVREKRYWRVLKHKNFNPRIVAWIVQDESVEHVVNGKDLDSKLGYALNHPMAIWKTVYKNQIDRLERVLVWVTFLSNGIHENQLSDVFDKFLALASSQITPGTSQTFESVTKALSGSLLKRVITQELPAREAIDNLLSGDSSHGDKYERVVSYELQNHSIADYLCAYWHEDDYSVKMAIEFLNSKAALEAFLKIPGDEHKSFKRDVLKYLTSDDCSASDIALRLKAFSELVKNTNDTPSRNAALAYLEKLDTGLIDEHGVDSFCEILMATMPDEQSSAAFLQRIPADNLRKIFRICHCVQDAIALYKLAPKSVFPDSDEVKDIISDRLVEYGKELITSWGLPTLEFDEDLGKMSASRYEIEHAEEKLAERFKELISGTSQLVDMIDVWDCVADVNVKEYYTADFDEYFGEEDEEISANSASEQIDNLFSALIQNS
ncbi:MAG: restriction endonuclease [Kiritimatiellae bacterium]|nr:restriction endonuclease [Kiritimatiellia bacterium]